MPRPASDRPLERICVRLYKSDYDEIKKLSSATTGTNEIIRTIVHAFVVQNRDRVRQAIDALEEKIL